MEAIAVPNWEAFTSELQKLRDELSKNAPGKPPELLFRGQSDSSWPLTTTLERRVADPFAPRAFLSPSGVRVVPVMQLAELIVFAMKMHNLVICWPTAIAVDNINEMGYFCAPCT